MKAFIKIEKDPEDDVWYIISKKNGDVLGEVYVSAKWNVFVFEPYPDTFFDSKCLETISNMLRELNPPSNKEKKCGNI